MIKIKKEYDLKNHEASTTMEVGKKTNKID